MALLYLPHDKNILHSLKSVHKRVTKNSISGHVLLAYRFLRLRLDCERIYRFTVLEDTEVKVRSGRKSGGTYIAYHFFLLHCGTDFQAFCKTRQVHICSGIYTVMLNLHIVSSTISLIGFGNNLSATDSINRSSRRSSIIHAMMRTIAFQHRMITAIGKARRDTVEIKRSLQESSLKAVSFLIVIYYCPLKVHTSL